MNEQNNDKKANILCLIALTNMIVLSILAAIVGSMMEVTDGTMLAGVGNILGIIVGLLLMLSPIVSVAIVIYVRIKYPKNLFGKILMWILIVMAAIFVVIVGSTLLFCMWCENEMSSCGFLILSWLLG